MNGFHRHTALSLYLLCLKLFQLVVANTQADRATLYFASGKAFDLPCRNETGGRFATVFWYTDAYTNDNRIRTDVYTYEEGKETIHSEYFENRLQRIKGTSLRIKDSKLTDSGKWTCDIVYEETTGGKTGLKVKTMAAYDVHIVGQPSVIDLSINGLLLKKGESTNVKIPFCESQALSDFNITWTKLSGTMSSNVKIGTSKPKKIPGPGPLTTYIRRVTLTFTNFSEQDVGQYQCTAKNIGGQLTKVMAARMRKPPLIFSRRVFNIDVGVVNGFLECKAKGYPSMDFTWRVYPDTPKSNLMHPTEHIDDFKISKTVYDSVSEIGSSRLTISKIKKSHHGKYICIASTNDLESTQLEIQLVGKAPPDTPVIIQENTKIEENEVTLFWKVLDDGGSAVTSVKIDYKNSSTLKDWSSVEVYDRQADSYTIQNLVKGTSYDFRIRASNIKGDSDYSEIFTLTTIGLDNGVPTSEPTTDDQILGNLDMTTMIGIFGGVFIALVVGFICVCIFVRKMQKGEKEDTAPPQQSFASFAPSTTPGTQQRSMVDGHAAAMEMQPLMMRQPDEWEFPRDRLTITTVLGAGAFGVVMKGLAQGIKGSVGQITVAVKTVRDTTNEAATKDLIAELNLLKLIPEHQNVVGLLGCCTYADPLYVIVEYCSNGDLQGFLRSSRGIYERYYRTSYGGAVPNLTSKMLLTFAWQVAKGMNHLSSMKVIHRDLAARNVLVDDQLVCKVSDFGFARDIYVEDHYLKRSAGGRFPIKWMAIESLLDGISTTKSDVWSFGVVFWELITLGASPYPGMNSYEVVSFLQDGYRMDKPKHCADEIYQLMMDCWCVAPGRRPSFVDLINKCQLLMDEADNKELINMNFYPDHLYVNFDGSNSSAVSTATTPHGTLTRNHINSVNNKPSNMIDNHSGGGTLGSNHHVQQTPRSKLRSPSNHSMPSGRTNSVPALSERSLTGASNHSFHANQHPSERVGLLSQMSQPS